MTKNKRAIGRRGAKQRTKTGRNRPTLRVQTHRFAHKDHQSDYSGNSTISQLRNNLHTT